MRRRNGIGFFLVIVVLAVLIFISFSGNLFGTKIPGSVYDIRQGIDINGGISATLYAVTEDGSLPTQEQLESAKVVIAKRLDKLGILDRTITTNYNNGSILLEIPWKPGETSYDPDKAIQEIGKTSLLTFREVDETKVDENGNYLPLEDTPEKKYIILKGDDVKNAVAETAPEGGMQVSLTLSDEGKKKFAEATARLIGKPIAIFMDDVLISAPIVQSAITDGNARITLGSRETDEAAIAEAKDLAATIRSGALPFKLEAKHVNAISPLLGKGALKVTINAAIVSFILVCLYMVIKYKLPGFLACIALAGHTVLELLFLSWLQITLTLPGLAGIILSMGMAVDANVIIFERIKEELNNGKTLRASIDLGFSRAFAAILDSNITTLIAGIMLLIFGTGALVSFGYTLTLGVILSFLTAITVSRILLKSVSEFERFKNHKLYGAKEAA